MGILKRLFGDGDSDRAWRDQWKPGTIGKNLISPVNHYGTCFSCEGSGIRSLCCHACGGTGKYSGACRGCNGTGQHHFAAQSCYACRGAGTILGTQCLKCNGTGIYRPASTVACKKCSGTGKFEATCRKCQGNASWSEVCRKCNGTGWHKF